jgi:protein tyrosine phosphatase (PTP) superfamily phosphohydrolase (DUF442 family)
MHTSAADCILRDRAGEQQPMQRMPAIVALVSAPFILCSCARHESATTVPNEPVAASLGKVEAAGLHNVFRLTDKLYSGSSPEGDAGFASLKQLDIQTIISVDGARPDVETARTYGFRYVHLPIGYDGVPREQGMRIAKAVRDLPGPVYIHCHHGKHRGPAAAAVAHLCLDEKCSVETALAEMRRAGTDPHYTGLYAALGEFGRPTAGDLDRVPSDFPEVSEVAALAQIMVGIDERWERLKLIRAANWKVPADYPDLDPPHEALQLREQYREASRLPAVREKTEEFRRWLSEAEDGARALEETLRAGNDRSGENARAAEEAFLKANVLCARCHARHRDVPRKQE